MALVVKSDVGFLQFSEPFDEYTFMRIHQYVVNCGVSQKWLKWSKPHDLKYQLVYQFGRFFRS